MTEELDQPQRCLGIERLGYQACLCAAFKQMRVPVSETLGGTHCLEEYISQLQSESREDNLTGLQNERALREEFRASIARGEPFAAMYIDIANFKDINNTWKHSAGDKALRFIANFFRLNLRASDEVVQLSDSKSSAISSQIHRKGGDEFFVFLHGANIDSGTAEQVAARLDSAFCQDGWVMRYNETAPPTRQLGLRIQTAPYDFSKRPTYEEFTSLLDPKVNGDDETSNFGLEHFTAAVEDTKSQLAERRRQRHLSTPLLRRLDDLA